MSNWVKVEFYGQIPEGQTMLDADLLEIAENLSRVFGFTVIDGLTVVLCPLHEPVVER